MLAQRELVEEAGDLEGAGDPERRDLLGLLAGDVLAVEDDLARGRGEEPGEEVEEGRLAGAVGAHEGVDRAGPDDEVDLGDGPEAAELLGQGARLEHGCRCLVHLHLLVPAPARRSGCRMAPALSGTLGRVRGPGHGCVVHKIG